MIRSLYEYINDLRMMNKEKIEKLEEWRNFCAANPAYMLAYKFDL
jgi:hypothetical protein